MKNITRSLAFAAILACVPHFAFGQANLLTPTTLSTALTTSNGRLLTVTSATGISAPTQTGSVDLWIDKELMAVEAVNSTTVTVQRGAGGTTAAPHASGALVFAAAPNLFVSGPRNDFQGSCTRSNLLVAPSINVSTAVISDCLGGVWVDGRTTPLPASHIQSPVVGGIAASALTSGVAMAATSMGCIEVDLPYNKLLTGIQLLNGGTAATDHHVSALYDATGNLLAHSATTGTLVAGTEEYQSVPFTTTFYAVGPALYYACYQTNGTTGLVHMADAGTGADTLYAGFITGQTFGTIPTAITPPTTFTSAQGPMVTLY